MAFFQYPKAGEQSENGQGVCGAILTLLSITLAAFTFPISLFFCIKVVQEYERAVIFRLVCFDYINIPILILSSFFSRVVCCMEVPRVLVFSSFCHALNTTLKLTCEH